MEKIVNLYVRRDEVKGAGIMLTIVADWPLDEQLGMALQALNS